MPAEFQFEIKPEWGEIDRVRQQTAEFLNANEIRPDINDAVCMVACELAENATKYGAYSESERQIRVGVVISERDITVEIKNPIAPDDVHHLDRLDEMIQWIRGYQDPFEAYLERFREVSAQHLDNRESGLGLVRIAYEGQSVLDFYINDKNVLAVSAMHRLAS